MKSGQQLAQDNLAKFLSWIAEREAADDWSNYIRRGRLNRTTIADECGFALSVLRQNPAVKSDLEALEVRLLSSGVLQASQTANKAIDEATNTFTDKRIMAAKTQADSRVKALEEENAALKAEVNDLRSQLTTYRHLDAHLCTTGRLLHA